MTEELRDVVNENDNVIAVLPRSEVREKNLLRRGVAAFVFNSQGEIFVHQRTNKDINPLKYDLLCGGGVQADEDYEQAIKRELAEEIGAQDIAVNFLFKCRFKTLHNNTISAVHTCISDGPLVLEPEEILHGKFISLKELEKWIKEKDFASISLEMYQQYKKLQNERKN